MYSYYASFLGRMVMISDGKYLTGLYFEGQKYFPDITNFVLNDNLEIFKKVKVWLDKYFAGQNIKIDKSLFRLLGTDFQILVWNILMDIPYGKMVTYKDIGNKILSYRGAVSYRAIGRAISHNPILIMIPCHRVIGSNGKLIGYAGGIDRKKKLLEIEQSLEY